MDRGATAPIPTKFLNVLSIDGKSEKERLTLMAVAVGFCSHVPPLSDAAIARAVTP